MVLAARDALTARLVRVLDETHPRIDQDPQETLYAVFAAEDPQRFLGLVSTREIAERPHRIFADLLGGAMPSPLAESTPLEQVYQRMQETGRWYLPVVDRQGGFVGAVTRSSILEVLLAENQRLTRWLFTLQEEERRYLCRELHDELGQYFAALRANLECLSLVGESQELQCQIEAIAKVVDHLYRAVRRMMRRLRPELLDHLGLVDALGELVEEYQHHYPKIAFELEICGNFRILDDVRAIVLYRIVQECLTNIICHAGARRVEICLCHPKPIKLCQRYFPSTRCRRAVCLTVCDDGKGLPAKACRHGFGLRGMCERVEALGGTFLLDSQPGQGVCIAVELPLEGK